jgi:DNA-binding NtrC family response regulator
VIERSLLLFHGRNLNLALPSIDSSHHIRPQVSGFQAYGRTLRDVTDQVDVNPVFGGHAGSCEGNKRRAARLLGIARDSLYRHMKRFGIEGGNPKAD